MSIYAVPNQQTISSAFHVAGFGYWSGTPITLTFRPAPIDSGICFRRTDIPGVHGLQAASENRSETPLRTRLESDHVSVDMIEHVMAALHAAEIDNCFVDCTAREMPGLDGSALRFALGIEQAGVTVQSKAVETYRIDATIRVGDSEQWVMACPSQSPSLSLEYRLDFGDQSPIPNSTSSIELSPSSFLNEVAAARTFITKADAELLQSKGMAKHVTYRDLIVFGDNGPIDNSLRFDDECSRHKLLDLIGDIALCGFRLQGKIVASKSGHVLNGRLAAELRHRALAANSQSYSRAA